MKMIKKLGSVVVLSLMIVGTAICATPKSAEEFALSNSPSVLQYDTAYYINYNTAPGKNCYGFEGCMSSKEADNMLNKALATIDELSKAVLDDETLEAKIAERDQKAAELEGASKLKKFFKEDEVTKLTEEIDTSIANKEKIEKITPTLEPLAQGYLNALDFEAEFEPYIKETFENVGFKFADEETILAATKKELDKREKKAKRAATRQALKNIYYGLDGLYKGNRNGASAKDKDDSLNFAVSSSLDLLGARLDDGKSDDDPKVYLTDNGYDDDMRKALKKATKAKSFIQVAFDVRTQWYDSDKLEGESKFYPQAVCVGVAIWVTDEDGKWEKCVEGYVKSQIQSQEETRDNPDSLKSQIPDLMKEALEYVVSNIHIVDKRKKNPGRMQKDVFRDVTSITEKQREKDGYWFY